MNQLDLFETTSVSGLTMVARILRPGDRYGRENCLVWGEDAGSGITNPDVKARYIEENKSRIGIEFYDKTYAGKTGFDPELGQFTGARYYLADILKGQGGLCLQGHVPEWSIGPTEMAFVRDWAVSRI